MTRRLWRSSVLAVGLLPACGVLGDDSTPSTVPVAPADGEVVVDLASPLVEISPLIRGVSGEIDGLEDLGATFNSWGGVRATRYNYQLGNAWNTGRAGAFRNDSVASTDDLVGDWLRSNDDAGVTSRVAVPALGWIAQDGDPATCSFPDESGTGCLTAIGFDCETTGPIADPRRANVGSSPRTVGEWIGGYVDERIAPDYLAVDNEPERWGVDHYDVHPTCADYFEILGTYVTYATALRAAAPSAQLVGPVMCCWYDFADAPGPPDGGDEDLLTWFLRNLNERRADAPDAEPLLDVVDLHFRPQADVVGAQSDGEAATERMEAVRELWDPEHRATGSREIVRFLPRVREIVDRYFPGMPLMISDWRFGGEDSMSGAVAVFETLGVFAREGVLAAAHADTLVPGTPAFEAFRLFGNYDGRGGAFEGIALDTDAERLDDVGSFAAIDLGTLRVGLVNRSVDEPRRVRLVVEGAETGSGTSYLLADGDEGIVETSVARSGDGVTVELPPMSAALVEVSLRDAIDVELPDDEPTDTVDDTVADATVPDETDETGTAPDPTGTAPDPTGTEPDETGTAPGGTAPDPTGTAPDETDTETDDTASAGTGDEDG